MAMTFTAGRRLQAQKILGLFDAQLHLERAINAVALEFELCRAWDVGFQAVKAIMIDIMANHPQYEHLAAYYAEFSNHAMATSLDPPFYDEEVRKMCVIPEFRLPLAVIYGASSWHNDTALADKRREYWLAAFDTAEVHPEVVPV